MKQLIRGSAILMVLLLLGACNLSSKSQTQQLSNATAEATASASSKAAETVQPPTGTFSGSPTATSSGSTPAIFSGSPPGEPPTSTASWLTDAKTPASAKNAYAVDGDDYLNNRLERPFDQNLVYRPDLDIQSASLTLDTQWFYVMIQLDGVQAEKDALIACYGAELDVNLDGRGEFVVWARPPFTTTWARENMIVYGSSKGTVGGPRSLLSDAPWKGDTYDTILFDGQNPSEVNAAWVRVSPADPKSIQIAFHPDILAKPTRFLWNAWADDGIKDPSRFDYNDQFTKQQAGVPYKWDPNDYPPKSVWAVDNTCRAPYGFKPVGNVPGGCQLPATPGPTTKGPTATQTLIPAPP
jgi:hypothetical protein